MSLFTDRNIASIEDLKDYESAVLQTASIEGIDVSAKLKLAQRGIGFEIAAYLARHGFTAPSDLDRVVVNEALLHWHCLHTLELIYRDAYNSQVNDRYMGKWKEYAQTAARAGATASSLGIGMVSTPLPKALAPTVSAEPGGALGVRTYFVAVAWQAGNGSTGERSDPMATSASISTLIRVTSGTAPASATGWYVYAGESDTDMRRQNALPIAVGSSWLEAANGLISTLADVPVQSPDWYVRNHRVLPRG
jgi:hypothetical protein